MSDFYDLSSIGEEIQKIYTCVSNFFLCGCKRYSLGTVKKTLLLLLPRINPRMSLTLEGARATNDAFLFSLGCGDSTSYAVLPTLLLKNAARDGQACPKRAGVHPLYIVRWLRGKSGGLG